MLEGRTGKKRKNYGGDHYAVYEFGDEDADEDDDTKFVEKRELEPVEDVQPEASLTTVQSRATGNFSNRQVPEPPSEGSHPAIGSALQRNPDGSIVQPKIRKRKKKKVCIPLLWSEYPH